MSGQSEPRKPLLILDHNREIIAEAIEISNALMTASGITQMPNQAEWDALPAKVRAGSHLPFVKDIGTPSSWTGNAEGEAPFAKERTC